MNLAAKTLAPAFLSLLGAFVWWLYFPEPPLPNRFLLLFEPIVVFFAGGDVHGGEELLTYLGLWCYVVAMLLGAWAVIWILRQRRG